MIIRAAAYIRVSTDEQTEFSPDAQLKAIQNYCKNNNMILDKEHIYIDEGISGTQVQKRDNFLKMINDSKEGKLDLIITKEISRFSRNTLDSIKYTRELLSFGVAVLFINDNINTALHD